MINTKRILTIKILVDHVSKVHCLFQLCFKNPYKKIIKLVKWTKYHKIVCIKAERVVFGNTSKAVKNTDQ